MDLNAKFQSASAGAGSDPVFNSKNEAEMRHLALLATSAMALLSVIPASAQTPAGGGALSATSKTSDWSELTDTRIAVIKAALQLRPDQQQYWPAIESAIRARSEARQRRIADLQTRMDQPGPEQDPVQIIKRRAEVLSQRADGLKKLADAWQPLYATLDDTQKRRMRVLAFLVVRELRNGIEDRRMDSDDEDFE